MAAEWWPKFPTEAENKAVQATMEAVAKEMRREGRVIRLLPEPNLRQTITWNVWNRRWLGLEVK